MRTFAYNSIILLAMATLSLNRYEAIKADFINLINSATDTGWDNKIKSFFYRVYAAVQHNVQQIWCSAFALHYFCSKLPPFSVKPKKEKNNNYIITHNEQNQSTFAVVSGIRCIAHNGAAIAHVAYW